MGMSIGRHPDIIENGFTPSSRYIFSISCCIRWGSFPYFVWISLLRACISGCTAMFFICERMAREFSGHVTRRTRMPNTTSTHPYAMWKFWCSSRTAHSTNAAIGRTTGRSQR